MRRTRLALTGALTLTAALATGCGEKQTDDPLAAYITRANAVQARSAAPFAAANATFAAFAKGTLDGPKATLELRQAEAAIAAGQERLEALTPPPVARRLHALLLRTYELNGLLAAEIRQLATYVPRAQIVFGLLDRISRRLARSLRRADTPEGQVRALERYVESLGRMQGALRRLRPPPVLIADRETQLIRVTRARSVAGRLSRAIARRDAVTVARLIVRFREGGRTPPGRAGLRTGAIAAYRQRIVAIDLAAAAARTEQGRLARATST